LRLVLRQAINLFQNSVLSTITTSATLIDHIYMNNITTAGKSGIIIIDLANHCWHILYFTGTDNQTFTKFVEDSENVFGRQHLEHMDFTNVLARLCPNEAYGEFIKLYKHAFETCFPLRTCKINNKTLKRGPWVTTGILISSKQKAKFFVRKLKKPTADNIAAHEEYNSMFNRLKRATKINYFQNALDENKQNIRKTWSILRKAMGKLNNRTNFPPRPIKPIKYTFYRIYAHT